MHRRAHHQGKNCYQYDGQLPLSLLNHCRIVLIDVRKFGWCSVGSVASHSIVWPRDIGEAKGNVHIVCANHCGWTGILVVRGRCFSIFKHGGKCRPTTWVLAHLLWGWSGARRPFNYFSGGNCDPEYDDIDVLPDRCETNWGDPIPPWLDECYCRSRGYCQCNVLGRRGYHHPGKCYPNLREVDHPGGQFFNQRGRRFRWDSEPIVNGCEYSRVLCQFPYDNCIKHTVDDRMAAELARLAIDGLDGFQFFVPPRSVLLREVPTRKKPLCTMYGGKIEDWITALLKQGEQRRSREPQPKGVAWEKRLRRNGSITNLAPVTHDARPHDVVAVAAPCWALGREEVCRLHPTAVIYRFVCPAFVSRRVAVRFQTIVSGLWPR